MLAKERSVDMYKLSAYFVARTMSDLPLDLILPIVFLLVVYFMAGLRAEFATFLTSMLTIFLSILAAQGLGLVIGAALMDVKRATTLASIIIMTFMLAGGFFIQRVPFFMSWIRYLSFNYHSYRLLLKIQYGCTSASQHSTTPCKYPLIKELGLGHGGMEVGSMIAMDCSNEGHCDQRKPPYRRALAAVFLFIILVLLVILIIWLVLRPSQPRFYLQDTSISQLNLTVVAGDAATNLLTTVMQVTLSSRNPNDRVGIYYDKLAAFAAYKGQQITAATVLSAGYQGHNDVAVWSPYLYGASVPLAPYLAVSLDQDKAAGLVLVSVKVDGRLRWKVGTWISRHYHLQANCPAFVTIVNEKGNSPAFHFQQVSACTVNV
ncbi:NDR1/HIN1-like protein 12 [Canna indica]|uniref:NDR1/HIN1-like protein 12 n=1 Tax=Canna indica TaxID=4628 RepID=A0AAQ3QRA5_9LILI|nr:NDR1/HIN1-like protein 12 [Canna indica]